MKAGWELVVLGDLCDILDSKRKPITKRDRKPGEYPYYGATGIQDFVDGFLFDEPLVLVGEDGAKWGSGDNTAFAVDGKCWVNNHAHVLRPNRTILIDNWLIHFLVYSDLSSFVSGLTVPKLNQGNLREIPIPFPSLPEQKRIVAILDEAFEAIAAARANAEQNRQNARALFESYLQSLFSQRGEGWVDSGNVLSSMCELIVDCEHKTAPTQDEGFPSIRTPNIGKGKLLLDDVKRVSEETYRAWTRRAVPLPGDLIFAREAPAGNVAVVPDGLQPCLGQRTVLIRPKKEAFDSLFLTYLLLSPSMQEHLLSHSKGSTVQHINMKDIRALRLGGIPAIKEQRELARQITDCSMNCERLESLYQRKIEALDELKQSLLQQAFSGNL